MYAPKCHLHVKGPEPRVTANMAKRRRNKASSRIPDATCAPLDDGSCPLLDKLPPELRNRIYEFAFEPNKKKSKTGMIDLARHKPPCKSLVLTCQQIHAESNKLYRSAYRLYWTSNQFRLYRNDALSTARDLRRRPGSDDERYLKGQKAQRIESVIRRLQERDLQHAGSITLGCQTTRLEPKFYDLLDKRGGWRQRAHRTNLIEIRHFSHASRPCIGGFKHMSRGELDAALSKARLRPSMKNQMEVLLFRDSSGLAQQQIKNLLFR